jgi:alpha-1,6-mannosyltransferase
VDRPARSLSSDLAVAGALAGMIGMVVVAGAHGSPLQPLLPLRAEPWAPLQAVARGIGLARLSPGGMAAVSVLSVVFATATFLLALREAWRGRISFRFALWLGVAFAAVAVVLPLLFSRDVYSYAIYGRIASVHHANPYVDLPQQFSSDPVFPFVGTGWRDTPAVYGPAFTMLSAQVTRVVSGLPALIVTFKLIAGMAQVGIIFLVARVARRVWPARATFAVMLVGWNPVVVIHGVAGGHNDLLVGLAVIGALALLVPGQDGDAEQSILPRASVGGRELLATAVLTLGMLVKATAVVPLVLLGVAVTAARPRGRRLRVGAAHAAVVLVLIALFAAPFLQTQDPSLGQFTLAGHEGWLAPTRLFRVLLGDAGAGIAGDAAGAAVRVIVRLAFAATFVVAFVAIARSTARSVGGAGEAPLVEASGRSFAVERAAEWGWALLLFTLLAPVLIPWYMIWTLPVAWALPRVPRAGVLILSTVATLSQTVADAGRFPAFFHTVVFTGHYVLTPIAFVLLLLLLRDLRRRLRSGEILADPPPAAPVRERVPADSDTR